MNTSLILDRSLYRLNSEEPLQGEIHDFLGEEIVQHPVVQNSILKDEEKRNLDQDLGILKLNKSLDESNTKSAPGPDGFSYKFITAFWKIFRLPLFECVKYGLENNNLPVVFKTVTSIKLIPKKGNTQDIKNWRPISLLSNFYKIISRAINNRLKTVANRILSHAQKGFNRARQLQEVILNTDQNISYCKKHNIKGVLVAIDQAKAFCLIYCIFLFWIWGQNSQMARNNRPSKNSKNNTGGGSLFGYNFAREGPCPGRQPFTFAIQLCGANSALQN